MIRNEHLYKIAVLLDQTSEIPGDDVAQLLRRIRNELVDALLVGIEIRGELVAKLAKQFVRLPLDQLCLDTSHTLRKWWRIYKSYHSLTTLFNQRKLYIYRPYFIFK